MLAANAFTLQRQPSQVREELAARVRRVRKQRGWTQVQLAERADVSLGSLRRFETTGKVSLESLTKLADVLGRLGEFDGLFVVDEGLERVRKVFDDLEQ